MKIKVDRVIAHREPTQTSNYESWLIPRKGM